MRRLLALVVLIAMLAIGLYAYDFVFPPHRFEVTLDEPAERVLLSLGDSNGDEITMMDGGPTDFTGSRNIGDASGTIRVEWLDGSATECTVGYITNSEREPHLVPVENRRCPEIGAHVQL